MPVDKGTLKHSGYTKPLGAGIEIGYTATHAAKIEYGSPAIPYTGSQTIHVQAFTRREHTRNAYVTKSGRPVPAATISSSFVQAHDRIYVNKRLIGFRPKLTKFERGNLIFRVMSEERAREGQFYLTRAIRDSYPYLSEDLEFELKKIPGAH